MLSVIPSQQAGIGGNYLKSLPRFHATGKSALALFLRLFLFLIAFVFVVLIVVVFVSVTVFVIDIGIFCNAPYPSASSASR